MAAPSVVHPGRRRAAPCGRSSSRLLTTEDANVVSVRGVGLSAAVRPVSGFGAAAAPTAPATQLEGPVRLAEFAMVTPDEVGWRRVQRGHRGPFSSGWAPRPWIGRLAVVARAVLVQFDSNCTSTA